MNIKKGESIDKMRLGVISDIHGNLSALTAVLEEFDRKKVDDIICLGDMVGYFHQSLDVLDLIRSLKIQVIKGNHEAYLLGELPCSPEREAIYNLNFVRDAISSSVLSWISSLPMSLDQTVDGKKILCFHGSPWDPLQGYIYPDYPAFETFQNIKSDFFFLGHTHYPLHIKTECNEVFNPGSIGLPRNGDWRAQGLIISDSFKSVEFIQEKYDIRTFLQNAKRNHVNSVTIQRLIM